MRGKDLFIVLAFAGCVIGQENDNTIADAGVSQTGNTTDSNVTLAQSDDTTTQENQIDPPTTPLKNMEVDKKEVITDQKDTTADQPTANVEAKPKDDDKQKEDDKQKQDKPPQIVQPNIIVVKQKPTQVEDSLIWGLAWWELLCIVVGSFLLVIFFCLCCCALLETPQSQEVRGPNGERLGFFQAPGRHIILVMDSRFNRNRGGNGATAVPVQTTAVPVQPATPETNPPHAPAVQPLYPKV